MEQERLPTHLRGDRRATRPPGLTVALVCSETRDRIVENCPRLQLGDAVGNHRIRRQQNFRIQDAGVRIHSGTAPGKEPSLGDGKLLAGSRPEAGRRPTCRRRPPELRSSTRPRMGTGASSRPGRRNAHLESVRTDSHQEAVRLWRYL